MPELALPWTAASLLERDGPPGEHVMRPTTLLVMADGSARRTEKAPGHLHPDALPFDDGIETALRTGDARRSRPSTSTGRPSCGARGPPASASSARWRAAAGSDAQVSYADAPYGVAWWVARWDLSPAAA